MKTITIRGEEWEVDYALCMLRGMQDGSFHPAEWAPRDALVRKDGTRATIYCGQEYDPAEMTIEKGGWDHSHCEVCNWEFMDALGKDHTHGYFNGYNWLCDACYRLFVLDDRLRLKEKR